MSNDIVFRRIRGRIVPIRKNKSTENRAEIAKGAGIAGAGLVLANVSGGTYQKAIFNSVKRSADAFFNLEKTVESLKTIKSVKDIKKAKSFVSRPTMQRSLFEFAEKNASAARHYESLRKAARYSQIASVFRKVAVPAGAAMVGIGVVKAVGGMSKDKKNKISPELAAGGGAAITYALPHAMELSKQAFEAGVGGRQATMKFAKTKFSSAAPYLKNAAMKLLKAKF